MSLLDQQKAEQLSAQLWEQEILPQLTEYIRIPNRSPLFDREWHSAGHMARAVELVRAWSAARKIPGLTVEVIQLKDAQGNPRTPVLYMETPGAIDDTVLLYGHVDKQPEMVGWREGLGPWNPVRENDKLYGRGGADDGYAAFASLAAIELLAAQNRPRARCVVLIEACEESGSFDLPAYIEQLAPRIGSPSLVVCLDSGCGNYDQFWSTTSLRGLVAGNLRVDVLREGVHSGDASGVVASSFRILRQVLSRIEDEKSGEILLPALHTKIPQERIEQARAASEVLGRDLFAKFPMVEGIKPVSDSLTELVLNRTWRPALSITGIDGIPPLDRAGNVLRPYTTAKLSMRIPPRVDPELATQAMKAALEKDPPYGARVQFEAEKSAPGWDAPPTEAWLAKAVQNASQNYFSKPAMALGEGGTIPFMGMLGERFPKAQFVITGLLGPGSNAHGPNEFLHIPTGKKLTCCVASILAEHAART